MDRTERFYKIQSLLRQSQSVSMRRLCDTLEVSRATVCRDLDYLRDRMGVPIAWSPALRGYTMESSDQFGQTRELPGFWFSQREIYALLSIMEIISELEPGGLLQTNIAPIRQRLTQILEQGSGDANTALQRIKILPMAQRNISSDHFQVVAYSLISNKKLHIEYYGRQTDEIVSRELSPQRLVYYRDNWYLDAYCHLRQGLRSFSVDAIKSAKPAEGDAIRVQDDELKRVFQSSYGIFNGPSQQVARLRFTAFRARWVARERWHPEQVGTLLPDGSYQLDVPYGQDWELIQDILKQGADVQVIAPDGLRHKIKEISRQMTRLYVKG